MVRAVLLATALAFALAGCNTSYNYFEDEADASEADRDSTAFGAILTMTGMVPEPKHPIKYRQRPPLAMPGSNDLPQPEDASAAQQAVNFPVDHDQTEAARRQAAYDRGQSANYGADAGKESVDARLSADEVVSGRKAGGGLQQEKVGVLNELGRGGFRLTRDQMKQKIVTNDAAGGVLTDAGAATPRKYLIQPPDEYRTPAHTAALPEKGDIENSEWIRKQLYQKQNDRTPARQVN